MYLFKRFKCLTTVARPDVVFFFLHPCFFRFYIGFLSFLGKRVQRVPFPNPIPAPRGFQKSFNGEFQIP